MSYRDRIIEVAQSQLGKRGPLPYSKGKSTLWCGHFVCWVLKEAGLNVNLDVREPGKRLCESLIATNIGGYGDIVRWDNGHCAILVPLGGVIAGGMLNDPVAFKHYEGHWKMRVYSIEELIRNAEMTGGVTGEVG